MASHAARVETSSQVGHELEVLELSNCCCNTTQRAHTLRTPKHVKSSRFFTVAFRCCLNL